MPGQRLGHDRHNRKDGPSKAANGFGVAGHAFLLDSLTRGGAWAGGSRCEGSA